MANAARGSVALQAGDTAYTVSFSVNALCELEEVFGRPAPKLGEIFDDSENIRISDVRKLILCGLHDHHPDVTEKDAGAIAGAAGLQACMDAITRAFQLAFPEATGNSKNPQKAKASCR
jgi:Protein of unknown function (DUF3356).